MCSEMNGEMSGNTNAALTLERLPQVFAVCKVVKTPLDCLEKPYCFYAHTADERSLVCPEADIPADVIACERGWQCYRVAGTLDFALIGILAQLTGALAAQGVSVFAVSTYDTDYLLVRMADAARAEAAWQASGVARLA